MTQRLYEILLNHHLEFLGDSVMQTFGILGVGWVNSYQNVPDEMIVHMAWLHEEEWTYRNCAGERFTFPELADLLDFLKARRDALSPQ